MFHIHLEFPETEPSAQHNNLREDLRNLLHKYDGAITFVEQDQLTLQLEFELDNS